MSNLDKTDEVKVDEPKITNNFVEKINVYEKLLKLDKPADIFLLLWLTFTSLWITTYQRPQFLQILLVAGAVILLRCAVVLFIKIFEYWFYRPQFIYWQTADINNQLLKINGKEKVNIGFAIFLLFLLLSVILSIVLIFEQVVALLIIGLVLLLLTFILFISYSKTFEFKYFTLVREIFTNLTVAIIYCLGGLFAFLIIINNIPDIAWELAIINIFMAFAFVNINSLYQKYCQDANLILSPKDYLIEVGLIFGCYLIFIVAINGFFAKIAGVTNWGLILLLLILILIEQAYRFITFYKSGQKNHQHLYLALQNSTLIPLLIWLVIFDWRTIFN